MPRRPGTPDWLLSFARDLYGGRCIRCHVDRPLEVAHLSNWTEVTGYVATMVGTPANPLVLQPDEAYWLFHQPVNVVLLCCNCHCLFDGPQYPDVTLPDILAARDAELATERATAVVRDYFCRGYAGTVGAAKGNVMNRWMPMLDWLQKAYTAGHLPSPHRFVIPYSDVVDLTIAEINVEEDPNPTLPRWNGQGFDTPS